MPAGWSNGAIGFGLLQVTLGLLEGRLDDAGAALPEIGRHPRYLHLGACSPAMKFELRLAHAKLSLAPPPNAMPVPRAGLCADLDDLSRRTEDTRQHLLQLDAVLLLAIASPPAPSARHLERARRRQLAMAACRMAAPDRGRVLSRGHATPASWICVGVRRRSQQAQFNTDRHLGSP